MTENVIRQTKGSATLRLVFCIMYAAVACQTKTKAPSILTRTSNSSAKPSLSKGVLHASIYHLLGYTFGIALS